MGKKGAGKFVLGAAIGAGLGLLFAPKKGKELRQDLKVKMDELLNKAKEIDPEELKEEFDKKLAEIKKELEDLDKEKVLKIAKKKGNDIKKKTDELVKLAVEKGTPVLKDAAESVRDKAVEVTKDVVKKLESIEIK